MHALPQEFTGRSFTAAAALREGVPRERLRRKYVTALGFGVADRQHGGERRLNRGGVGHSRSRIQLAVVRSCSPSVLARISLPPRVLTWHKITLTGTPSIAI